MTNLKIITLFGKGNTGKTTTINKVIESLSSYRRELKEYSTDKLAVIDIEGFIIGITTRGDSDEVLETDFDWLTSHNCDLYLCASRSKGKTLSLLNNYTSNGQLIRVHSQSFEHFIKEKQQVSAYQDVINTQMAELILEIINKIKNNMPI